MRFKCACMGCLDPPYKLGFCHEHYVTAWLASGIPVKDRENMGCDEMVAAARKLEAANV